MHKNHLTTADFYDIIILGGRPRRTLFSFIAQGVINEHCTHRKKRKAATNAVRRAKKHTVPHPNRPSDFFGRAPTKAIFSIDFEIKV